MQYHLRSLMIFMGLAPPLLAAGYWTGQWLLENYLLVAALTCVLIYLGFWVAGPLAWYFEIVEMICGSGISRSFRRKTRRSRIRIEKYYAGST